MPENARKGKTVYQIDKKGYYSIFRSTIGPKPHWSDAADEDYKVITGIDK